MVVYAVELHLFINPQEYLTELQTVLSSVGIEAFDLWRTFESFLKATTHMPS